MSGLQLVDVGKRYRRRPPVLREISLDIALGEVVSVTGANGCGKSTLVRIAAGLLAPTQGEVHAPSRFALLPDRFAPPQQMTGRGYLAHHARMRRLVPGSVDPRIDELGRLLGIAPGLDVPLGTLSQGNARKVQIAQAFLAPVELVLLDEANAALDEPGIEALERLIADAARLGAAVLRIDPSGVAVADARRARLVDGAIEEDSR